jgi:hypothetical protein
MITILIIPNLTVLKACQIVVYFLTFLKVIEIPACSKQNQLTDGAGLDCS